jgi:cytochrome c553
LLAEQNNTGREKMKKIALLLTGIALTSTSAMSVAADIEAGKAKAAICATCHGANGKATMNTYPNLAGQNEPYLVSALKAYKAKERNGGMAAIMQMQAANLSDDDINNLAAYYASLK